VTIRPLRAAGRLAGQLSVRRKPAGDAVADCVQCGQLTGVRIGVGRGDRVRCSCRACQAVFWTDAAQLKPLEEMLVAQRMARRQHAPASDLEAHFPPVMAGWLRDLGPRGPVATRAAVHELYSRFDSFADQARENPRLQARFGQLCGVSIDSYPAGLPGLNTIVAALGNSCYAEEVAVTRLAAGRSETYRRFLADRVAAVNHWLRTDGTKSRWIEPAVRRSFRDPEPDRLAALLANALAEAGRRDYPVLMRALFGTDRGPALASLREVFSDAQLLDAVTVFRDTGERPLLAWALAQAGVAETVAR
jgi:hypothetical protein